MQVLVEVKVLEPENIEKKFAETLTNEGHIREVKNVPTQSHCLRFHCKSDGCVCYTHRRCYGFRGALNALNFSPV